MPAHRPGGGYDLVYLRRGHFAHIKLYVSAFDSYCGLDGAGREGGWRGTGTQDEHDRAAALTLCPKCAKFLDE